MFERESEGGLALTAPIKKDNGIAADKDISMMGVLAVLLITFVLWAVFFKFDTTVRATGKVIPNSRTQVVQAADGGVLEEILVREGSFVKKGQLLAVLEKERASAKYLEENARVTALEIALIRAQAESKNKFPKFDAYKAENVDIVNAQYAYYKERKKQLGKVLNMLQLNFNMATTEMKMNKLLLESGDASRVELMRSQRQVNDVSREIMEARNAYINEAHEEIIKTEAELKSLRYKLHAAKNILSHTDILSPVDGVVKFLGVNTLGGVLRSSDELMQISPSKGGLMVEAKVQPVDISGLHLDMPVLIKLDAYDSGIYGNLKGDLRYISSDTLTEKDANGRESVFYSVNVFVDEAYMKSTSKLSSIKLKPGMNVTIDIITGEKTVFNYIAKPITKVFSGAVH